jgi:hypothetical protein
VVMTAEQLKGYLLEEALAYLIRCSGFKLITTTNYEKNLRLRGNGLQIKGRGGWHQADVLGRLAIIPAFTFPMRLFIEAKYKGKHKLGVSIVRNAIGTIVDLNTTSLPVDNDNPIPYNYRYEYALFSATGFNEEATQLALAHGISLIDLSTSDYNSLLTVISKTANLLLEKHKQKNLLKQIRKTLRIRLEIYHNEYSENNIIEQRNIGIATDLNILVNTIRAYDRLYIGTVNAPFMLLLKADNPAFFEEYSLEQEGNEHLIEMHWNQNDENGGHWTINPELNPEAYRLGFRIPMSLYEWIFKNESKQIEKAIGAKKKYMSEICVYLHHPGVDKVIKLKLSENFLNRIAQI